MSFTTMLASFSVNTFFFSIYLSSGPATETSSHSRSDARGMHVWWMEGRLSHLILTDTQNNGPFLHSNE